MGGRGGISPDFRILGPQVKPEGTGGERRKGGKRKYGRKRGKLGKEEEMDERHVHQCLDAHFDTEFFIFFPSKSFKAWARCC